MGPQEKRLTSDLAVYLIRCCSRALQALSPGETLDLTGRRRWFEQAYREWQLAPRVDLAGRSPYEVIAAERAALAGRRPARLKPTIELYTDLPAFDLDSSSARPDSKTGVPTSGAGDTPGGDTAARDRPPSDLIDPSPSTTEEPRWQRLADQLFGSWLDDTLDQL